MKRSLSIIVLAVCFSMVGSSCASDQCITCSYTEPITGDLITEPEVCGSKSVVDTKEESAQRAADAIMSTDFACVRK